MSIWVGPWVPRLNIVSGCVCEGFPHGISIWMMNSVDCSRPSPHNCLLMGGAVLPPVGCSPWGDELYDTLSGDLQGVSLAKGHLLGLLLPVPLSLWQALLTHTFTRDPPTLAGRSGSVSFPLGPGACKILFVPSKRGVSVSTWPLEVMKSNPAGLQSQIPWDSESLLTKKMQSMRVPR